jgi:hypothetical protein
MNLAEVGEIFGYWEANPPSHLMLQTIARMLGWTPRAASPSASMIEDIAASAPAGLAVACGVDLGMPAPLDIDALRAQNQTRALAVARRNLRAAVAGQ